tara:strand:+ start:625 stop:2205 length:1581 start_codon:yes stop_codon:yes gene_type:complete
MKTKHYIFHHKSAPLNEVKYEAKNMQYINLDKIGIPSYLKVENLSEDLNRKVFSEYLGVMTLTPGKEINVGIFPYAIPYKYSYNAAKELQFPVEGQELSNISAHNLPPITFERISKTSYDSTKQYSVYNRPYIFRDDYTNEIMRDIDNKPSLKISKINQQDIGPFNTALVVEKSQFLKYQLWLIKVTKYLLKKYGAHSIMMGNKLVDAGKGKSYTEQNKSDAKYRYHAIGNVLERCTAYYFNRTILKKDQICLKHHVNKKPKIYIFSSPSHDDMKEKYFLPSIKDDVEIVEAKQEQTCTTGEFHSAGWETIVHQKIDLLIRAIHENWNGWFIHSDVDIQFFHPIIPTIQEELKRNGDRDIVFQADNPYPRPTLCAGFFACRGNQRTLRLWQDVKQKCIETGLDDQVCLNQLLTNYFYHLNCNDDPINWGTLPDTFYGPGSQAHHFCKIDPEFNKDTYVISGRHLKYDHSWTWKPENEDPSKHPSWAHPTDYKLKIPHGIMMHHANYTIGIENKIKQLDYVKDRLAE